MSRHTPGPWSIDSGVYLDNKEVGVSNGFRRLAIVNAGAGEREAIANAHLIAAAPELLAALEGLFEHCAMIHKYGGEISNAREADHAQELGLAAIRKAKGEIP